MNSPSNLLQLIVTEDRPTPSFVDRVYGEPLFHTESEVYSLAFGDDNTLWTIEEAGLVRQWNLDGRLLQRHFLSDLEDCWTFSPDATRLASGTTDVALWDVAKGRLKARRQTGEAWVTCFAFSQDGHLLASGDDEGVIRLWEVEGLKLIGQFQAHEIGVSSLAFTPDATGITSAGEDHMVRLWDVKTFAKKQEWHGHTDRIPALLWSPNGEFFITAGWDTTARVWEPSRSEPLMLLNAHSDQVNALAFAPDGSLACADSDFAIHIWSDPRRGKARCILRGHNDEIRSLSFSRDGKRLASAGADRVVHIWDTEAGKLVAGPNPAHRHSIALAGDLLFSTSTSSLLAYQIGNSTTIWKPQENPTVYSVAASPDGKTIVSTGPTPIAQVWDVSTQKLIQKLEHTKGPIGSPVFSPNGKQIATASQSDGLVWIWEVGTPEAILVIPEAADASTLEAMAYHPNGKYLAVGGIDFLGTSGTNGSLCIWDLEAKDKYLTLSAGVTSLAFDHVGVYLVAGAYQDNQHTLLVWNLEDGAEQVFNLPGHQDRINAVTFSKDGSYIISGSDDCTIRIWDVLSGRLQVVRQFDAAIQSLTFSADGKTLFAGLGNTSAIQMEFKKLLEE